MSQSQKHPIILHGKDKPTFLIVLSKHLSLLYSGPNLLLSVLGITYHIIGARRLVRSVCRTCVTCRKISVKTEQQIMGQLPPQRVTPSAVFSKTVVDFTGPFTLKKGHTRRPVLIKSYVCVFVCFCTKAAHLEPVSDLTTEAFLAPLSRFIARRGLPKELFSDNGSNFVDASHDLKDFYSFLSLHSVQNSIFQFLSSQQIFWHFSPERAAHFGGLWEAVVKSTTKYHT